MLGRTLILPCRTAVLLAALALLLRIAVPAGFMPMAGGGPALMPCPAAGPVAMPMAMAGHHAMAHGHAGDHERDPGHACPFGAFAALADRADNPLAALPLPRPTAALIAAARRAIAPGLGLAAPPPPKTGPPALS